MNRVLYLPGWTVTLEKKEKPSEVYSKEKDERAKRNSQREAGGDPSLKAASTDTEKQERQSMDEMRRKWITKVTFEGGSIPPDGFQQFLISFQLPEKPGRYRFAAVQTYADGKEVSWSELVEGAEHPAASLSIQREPLLDSQILALPLSAVALLISLAALGKRSKAPKIAALDSPVRAGGS